MFLYRKTPGGVFLTLVKKVASDEQSKQIFHFDKVSKAASRKERRKRVAVARLKAATAERDNQLLSSETAKEITIDRSLLTCNDFDKQQNTGSSKDNQITFPVSHRDLSADDLPCTDLEKMELDHCSPMKMIVHCNKVMQ